MRSNLADDVQDECVQLTLDRAAGAIQLKSVASQSARAKCLNTNRREHVGTQLLSEYKNET